MRSSLVLASVVFTLGASAGQAMAARFGEIRTFDPLTDPVVATFGVDLNNVQTWSGQHIQDAIATPYPDIHWVKYIADGNSAVTFDTYGTNVSSQGPNPDRTQFLNAGNATQIAVYDASGNLVARTGSVKDINGELVPEFPSALFDSNDPNYHLRASAVQLSELIFMQNAPDNPHWDTSPGGISDPNSTTQYEGLHIDCYQCSGQKYGVSDPLSPNFWNEYRVWNETLPGVINNTLAGWRVSDHYNVGPGASWNRYNILPAGEYYIAVTGAPPVFSGDTYHEEVLQAPVHAGWDYSNPINPVFLDDVTITDGPMGPFEIYVGDPNPDYTAWGTIQLNITHYSLALDGDLNGDGFVGIADLNIVLGLWNQSVTPGDLLQGDPSGDGFVGIADLNLVLGNWNAGTPPSAPGSAVPEPATLALLSLGGLTALRRRR